jgi:hypothetical protein
VRESIRQNLEVLLGQSMVFTIFLLVDVKLLLVTD